MKRIQQKVYYVGESTHEPAETEIAPFTLWCNCCNTMIKAGEQILFDSRRGEYNHIYDCGDLPL